MLLWQLTGFIFRKKQPTLAQQRMIKNEPEVAVRQESAQTEEKAAVPASLPLTLIEFIGLKELKRNDLSYISNKAVNFIQHLLPSIEECWLWCRQEEQFKLMASTNSNLMPACFPVTGSLAAAVNELTQPLYIPDLKLDSFGFYDQLMVKLVNSGKRSLILAPINKMGALVLASSLPSAFSSSDQERLSSIITQLSYIFAVSFQQEGLKNELQKQTVVQEALLSLQTKATLQEKIKAVLAMAVKISQADSGSFLIYDQKAKKLKVKAVIGSTKGIAPGVEISLGQGIAGWVAQHKKPLIINDAFNGQEQIESKVASSISLPVISGEMLIGVLNLSSQKPKVQFSLANLKPVLQLLGQFGDAIVAALQNEQWQKLYFKTVTAITQLIEKKEPYYEGHTAQVAEYAKLIGKNMGLKDNELFLLELAALLHDIGVAASEAAVFEGRPLTTLERLALQKHPKIAVSALADIPQLHEVLPLILHHHENYDGSGYPDGLKGEHIPLGARILRVAEAYTAMTSNRPYRDAKSQEEALDELRRLSGSQFDPKVVYAFSKLMA